MSEVSQAPRGTYTHRIQSADGCSQISIEGVGRREGSQIRPGGITQTLFEPGYAPEVRIVSDVALAMRNGTPLAQLTRYVNFGLVVFR